MSKVKKGTIFKILIVALLIILSTIGFVLSNVKEQNLTINDGNKDNYDVYEVDVDLTEAGAMKLKDGFEFNASAPTLNENTSNWFCQLQERRNVLCSQQHFPLNDAKYTVFTKFIHGSPAQSYVLRQLGDGNGYEDYHDDPVQNAWWSMLYQLGVSGALRANSTGGYGAGEGEFIPRYEAGVDKSLAPSAWSDTFMMLPSNTTAGITENELIGEVYAIVEKHGFEDNGNDWYDAIIYLLNSFGQSNTTYENGFINANGYIDVKNLISSINVYGRFMDAVKEQDNTNVDYEKQYKEMFEAEIDQEEYNDVLAEYKKVKADQFGNKVVSHDSEDGEKYLIITNFTEANDKHYVLDGNKVYEIFKYTDNETNISSTTYDIGVDLNYDRRPKAYADLMTKFKKEDLEKLYWDLMNLYFDDEYTFVGEGYDYTQTNSLLASAIEYEKFYESLKADPKIKLDASAVNVNRSETLNAFVVGPFVAEYKEGHIDSNHNGVYELFGGIDGFTVETDKRDNMTMVKPGDAGVDTDNRLTKALENNQFALVDSKIAIDESGNQKSVGTTYKLCGTQNYPYPSPNKPFYIVFNAGAGDSQITNVGYNYTYLSHQSSYAYYELWYNGVDMQDLAEIAHASLFYKEANINVEMQLEDRFIELSKKVNCDFPVPDRFYFDVFVEVIGEGDSDFEYDYVKYKKYRRESVLSDGSIKEIKLPKYYKKEYGSLPRVLLKECDQYGAYYDEPDTWKEDSYWNHYEPTNGNGVYEVNETGKVEAENKLKEKTYPIVIEKKMKENPNGYTFFAKLDVAIEDVITRTYLIPLKPMEDIGWPINVFAPKEPNENGYFVCENYGNGDKTIPFGSIETGRNENGELYAKWSHEFKFSTRHNITYEVVELDNKFLNFENGKNTSDSIWQEYNEPTYDKNGSVLTPDTTTYIGITNTEAQRNLVIDLDLSKLVQNEDGEIIKHDKNFEFFIEVNEIDKNGNTKPMALQTLSVLPQAPEENSDSKKVNFNYVIENPNKDSKYKVNIKEINSSSYSWIDADIDIEGWQAETDEEGNIQSIYYEIDGNAKETLSADITITNKQKLLADNHNKFSITKTIQNELGENLTPEEAEIYFEENPDTKFTFRIETRRGKALSITDFDGSYGDKISEANGDIYVTFDKDNYGTIISTNDISWGADEIAPVYEIYEIDEEENTYLEYIELGEGRPLNSIWNDFTPIDDKTTPINEEGGHFVIDFFTDDSENIEISAINKAGTVEKQLTITKEVEGKWEDNTEFYFRILSFDGEKANLASEYFDEEHITTLKNGLKVVKITKDNPTITSKKLTLSTLEALPKFWVTEVDQYGNAWSEIPENEDSLWNFYTPERSGTWTCRFSIFDDVLDLEIKAKNSSNLFTLKKDILTNGESKIDEFYTECPDAEFYFRLLDKNGNVITNKYFETTTIKTYNYGDVDAIVVKKDEVTSLPIAKSLGDKFTLQEVFKTKEEENLYSTKDGDFLWTIDFSENNDILVTAENIAENTLTIDKVVENAPDNFLPDEEFHFKVYEGEEDVTSELFGEDTVIITETKHKNGGETSKVIYGNHNYVIVEFDPDGTTYKEYTDGTESNFWDKFTPSNNGKWEVSLGDTKGPSFVEAINYITTVVKIEKETEGDQNTEFPVTLMVWLSEGTNWFYVDDVYYPIKGTPAYENSEIKISGSKSYTSPRIYWSGEAPRFQVFEQTDKLPENWNLNGYKVNGVAYKDSPILQLNADAVNSVVVVNEYTEPEPDIFKLPVMKTIVDENGNKVKAQEDQTFYFDVYLALNENIAYDGKSISDIKTSGNYSEDGKYVKVETLAVTIEKGKESARVETKEITVPNGESVDYKIVEVDAPENGIAYQDHNPEKNPNSLWNKFKPTGYSDEKSGNIIGIWIGTLSTNNNVPPIAKIDAYNVFAPRTIKLNKKIITEGKYTTEKFFTEYPEAEFYFTLLDSEGNVVTNNYFETKEIQTYNRGTVSAIVINKDNYPGIESSEIPQTAGDKFTLIEVFKTKQEENLYNNTDKQFVWEIDFSKNSTAEITAENIAEKRLTIDKVVENAPDNFLPDEEFHFKVYEGKEDVTSELFGEDTVIITETKHKNGGETSKVIYGNHNYVIVEFDPDGTTYKEYTDGTESKFWDKFTPSNNGKWEVSLGDTKGPSFVEAINYLTTVVKIEKETEGDQDKEFNVSLMIWLSEGTNWFYVDDVYYPTKGTPAYENNAIKISVNKSYTSPRIYWSGEAPRCQVIEDSTTLSEGWTIDGYKVNGEYSKDAKIFQLNGEETNTVVVVNEYTEPEPDQYTIPVLKTIVDQTGHSTTSEEDQTFYFDIYVESDDEAIYNGKTFEEIKSANDYISGNYDENGKYVRIDTLEVFIPAGTPKVNNKTEIITLPKGTELGYKVVEVDAPENGISFKDYKYDPEKESIWDKFEPTTYSNNQFGSSDGIWNGMLSPEKQIESEIGITAYNKLTKVTLELEKYVLFEGKQQPIEEGETFKFIAEYKSSLGRTIEPETMLITPEIPDESRTFELLRGETIEYTITEVDPDTNTAYDPQNLTEFWKQFTPANGTGIETGTIDGSDANITLIGINIENPVEVSIPVSKTIIDQNGLPTTSEEDQTFYFDIYVENQETSKYKGKFINEIALEEGYISGNYAEEGYVRIDTLEVTIPAGQTTANAETDIITLNKTQEIKYKVVEVDAPENGVAFKDYEANSVKESLWDKFEPTIFSNGKFENVDGIWTGTLNAKNPVGTLNKVDAYNKFTKVNLELEKYVFSEGKYQPIEEGETFKFIAVYESNVGRKFATEEILITPENPKEPKTFELLRGETIKYTITEVDPDTNTAYDPNNLTEFWKKFTPADGTGIITGMVDGSNANITLTGTNISTTPIDVSIPVSKTIVDQNGLPTTSKEDQTFYFDIYVEAQDSAEYKGKFVKNMPSEEGYISGNYADEGFVRIDTLEVTIPAGETSVKTETDKITLNKSQEIKYKVVEVDALENGVAFKDYKYNSEEESLWDKFEPTMAKDGQSGNKDGIWEGTLSTTNQNDLEIGAKAYNKLTKVTLKLEKTVYFEGELQSIEEKEEFKFNAEYKSSLGRTIEPETMLITPKNLEEIRTFELLRGETIEYTITEVDPDTNTAYDPQNLTEFWKKFTPVNGTGIETGTIDGSEVMIELEGKNNENVHGWLAIVKEKADWLEHEKFYFEVYENNENVTTSLFSEEYITTVNGKEVVELNYTTRQAISEEKIWKSETTAPTYTIKEVEYDKSIYTPKNETQEVTLVAVDMETKLTTENVTTVPGYGNFVNEEIKYDKFIIEKVIQETENVGTNGVYSDTFYAIVLDEDGNNVTESLFDGENAEAEIVKLRNDKIPAVKLTKDISALTEDIQITEIGMKYKVVEVDCDGYSYAERTKNENKESVWNKGYEPENGTGEYNVVLVPQENKSTLQEFYTPITIINLFDGEPEIYTITKTVVDNAGNNITDDTFAEGEHFYFKVTDGTGKDVVSEIFADKNINTITVDDFELIDLSIDQKAVTTTDIFTNETYTVTETDQYGVAYDDYEKPETEPEKGWSVWEEYKPEESEDGEKRGVWYLNEAQTSVNAINEDIVYEANIVLSKQTTFDWKDGDIYKFNVYVKQAKDTEDPTPIEVELSKDIPAKQLDPIIWNSQDGAPSIKIEEINLPEGVTLTIKVGEKEIKPGEYYELPNEDGMYTTFNCINDGGKKENANLKVIKSALNNEVYTFAYEYGYYENGEWVVTDRYDELKVLANSIQGSETVDKEWYSYEQAPMFRIWETSGNLESISATNTEGKSIEVEGHSGIEGTLNSEKQVIVSAINGADKEGKLEVLKTFDSDKQDIKELIEWLIVQYNKKGIRKENVTFAFNVSISYADKNSKFYVYDNVNKQFAEEPCNTWNKTYTWTLADFENAFNGDNSDNTVNILGTDEIKVKWSGEAPEYSVNEIYSNPFWNPESKINTEGCLQDGVTITSEIINTYNTIITEEYPNIGGPEISLLTSLAGDVWIETPKDDKTIKTDGIRNIGLNEDVFASDIYVVPYRCIVDSNGNVVEGTAQTNSQKQFIHDFTGDYLYISKDDQGHWEFPEVYVPAFNLDDSDEMNKYGNGYKVKYYVDFYYDGIKYQPTLDLVDGSAEDYLQLNTEYDKYYDNSLATESAEDRSTHNEKYATINGKTQLQPDGTSKGEITNSNGEVTAEIGYESTNLGTSSNSEIIRTSSTGTVIRPELNNLDAIKSYYMRASTTNLGLNYFFKDLSLSKQNPSDDLTKDNNDDDYIDGALLDLKDIQIVLDTDAEGNEFVKYIYIYEEQENSESVLKEFVSADYAQHINLGLVQREQADISISKKIESATIVINEKSKTYNFNNDGVFVENLISTNDRFTKEVDQNDAIYKLLTEDLYEDENALNIYTSDYNYRADIYDGTDVATAYNDFMNVMFENDLENLIKTKELQVFLTYGITLTNHSAHYDIKVNSIVDYYDSSLTYVDVSKGYYAFVSKDGPNKDSYKGEPGIWAYLEDENEKLELTNILKPEYYDNTFTDVELVSDLKNANFKEMIMSNVSINANESKSYYVTYRADKADALDSGIILDTKNNIAEIASFTPYIHYENPENNDEESTNNYEDFAAVIDKNSAPGNYNIDDENLKNIMEDDTDFANVELKLAENESIRTISGKAWLDNTTSTKAEDNYAISGITTKLVEVIDLPNVDGDDFAKTDDGNVEYTEYEFYWEDANTTTNKDGSYKIDNSADGEASGLVPGNYEVRFFYGDKDTEIYNSAEENVILETQINGEDYKTVAYSNATNDTNGYVNNEWHDSNANNANDNDARDNEARRLAIIEKTYELTNENTAIFEIANHPDKKHYVDEKVKEYKATLGGNVSEELLEEKRKEFEDDYDYYKAELYGDEITYDNGTTAYNNIISADGYSMFADTAKLNLKIENQKFAPKADAESEESNTQDATTEELAENSGKGYDISNIEFGLEERPKTNIYLDKQIEEITLKLPNGKTFFHSEYDIKYSTDPELGWNRVADGLYVKLIVNEESLEGEQNLQQLDDSLDKDNIITRGLRYINIESEQLHGLSLAIKYRITAINLSKEDWTSKQLAELIDEAVAGNTEAFNDEISKLSSPDYLLVEPEEGDCYLVDSNTNASKTYGEVVGKYYYTGVVDEEKDAQVTTTVRKVVDYIDNDIDADLLTMKELDGTAMWDKVDNSKESFDGLIDKHVFNNEEIIQNDTENAYKTILVSSDDSEANKFVKALEPVKDGDINDENIATINVYTSKTFEGTDKGRTGMDNFAEILMIQHTVGRRDIKTVYGNYNPRGGATQTTERDESSTEMVTLSAPTGNIDNENTFRKAITIICIVSILAGTGVGIKLKVSSKKKKTE